jgi:hypothetical protein
MLVERSMYQRSNLQHSNVQPYLRIIDACEHIRQIVQKGGYTSSLWHPCAHGSHGRPDNECVRLARSGYVVCTDCCSAGHCLANQRVDRCS